MSESTSIASIHDLVEALGGNIALARMLKIEANSISMWFARGFIPTGWHLRLFLEARRRGLVIDPALFDLPPDAFAAVVATAPAPDGPEAEVVSRRA